MSMAEKPPLLLFSNLELKDAGQHVARLKRSGIGFKVVESKVTPPEESEIFIDSAAQSKPSENYEEFVDNQPPVIASQNNAGARNQTPVSENLANDNKIAVNNYDEDNKRQPAVNHEKDVDDRKRFNESTVNYRENAVTQESTQTSQRDESSNNNVGDKKQSDEPIVNHQKNIVTQEPAKISQRGENSKDNENNVNDKKQPDKKSALDDNKKQSDKNDIDKKQSSDEKSSAQKNNSVKADADRFKSGIRIGSFERAEQSEKKSSRKQTIMVMSIFIIAAAILFFLPKEKTFAVKSADAPAEISIKQDKSADKKQNKKDKKSRAQKDDTPKSAQGAPETSQSQARKEVSAQQRHEANAYVDSAKTLGRDPESIIAFYKFAISFNPQNLAAWQGLLQAYRDLEMDADARSTEEQMRKIFGERIESINLVVKPFGELIDTYVNDDGTYRVEYRSNKRSRNDIINDVFLLTRAVRTSCSCENISIYASTGTGRGLISHSGASTSVHSLSAFSDQAQIIWLD